jgi:hypothetical protein
MDGQRPETIRVVSAFGPYDIQGQGCKRLPGGWWLRSRHNNNDNNAGVVDDDGSVNNNTNNKGFGVRPASP